MSVTNGIITTPIGWHEPYQCMGAAPYNNMWDAGYICSNAHGKLKAWSVIKPIAANTAFYTPPVFFLPKEAWDDPNTSGWETVQDGTITGTPIVRYNLRYKTPVPPYRMTDWDGYNHNSVAPGFEMEVKGYVGAGQGSSYIGNSESAGKGTMRITYPQIRPGALPVFAMNDAAGNPDYKARIQVVSYWGGIRRIIWTLDCSQITAAQWATNYAGKTVSIEFTQNFNLPSPGGSTDTMYYMEINGCHYANGVELGTNNRMWRQWNRNPDIESNWKVSTVTKPTTPEVWGTFHYLDGRTNTGTASDGDFKYRIRGLLWENIDHQAAHIYVGGTLAVTVTALEVTYHTGAEAYNGSPQRIQDYTYTNRLGTQVTAKGWDFGIHMAGKNYDASVEITVGLHPA